MSEVLFKSQRVKKMDFYNWLKNEMIKVGWENISSRPSVDNDIFYSKGESNEEELYVRMKEYYFTSTTTTISSSTSGIYLSLAPLSSYKPGNTGVSGIAYPPLTTSTFSYFRISKQNMPLDCYMTVYYHINKDRVVLVIEWDPYLEVESVFCLFGKPTNIIAKTTDITKTVVVCSCVYGSDNVRFATLADYYEYASGTTGSFLMTDIQQSRNESGDFFMTEIAIANPVDGFHSLVDGIYAIPKDSRMPYLLPLTGDELIGEDSKRYRITPSIPHHSSAVTVFTHPFLAFQLE